MLLQELVKFQHQVSLLILIKMSLKCSHLLFLMKVLEVQILQMGVYINKRKVEYHNRVEKCLPTVSDQYQIIR